jgi:ADP-ribose pyrophosphatase YjhB (NUDIX family)
MSDTPRHSVSVAAAVFDDSGENVLLIKRRDNGRWEPPGGVLELDETIEDGLRREVREETGAEIAVGPLTGVYKNMRRGIVALVFRCSASTPTQRSTAEAAEVAWLPISAIKDHLVEAYAIRVLDAASNQSRPRIRMHDGLHLSDTQSPSGNSSSDGTC